MLSGNTSSNPPPKTSASTQPHKVGSQNFTGMLGKDAAVLANTFMYQQISLQADIWDGQSYPALAKPSLG